MVHDNKPLEHDATRGRRIGLRANPPGRLPPRVLVNPRWQRSVPLLVLLGGLLSLGIAQFQPRGHRWHGVFRWWGMLFTGGVGLGALGIWQTFNPKVERLELAIPELPSGFDGLLLAQISDMHLDEPVGARNAEWAVRHVMAHDPELIVVTGDFVSHSIDASQLAGLLQQLHAPLGVFGIWGNHDYWVDIPTLRRVVELAGVRILDNKHVVLTRNGDELYLAGIDDLWEGMADLDRALWGIPQDAPVILLAHEPDIADEAAERNIALQLSGHTHGGHIALPLLGPAFLPRHGWKYVRGLHQIKDMLLYISHGLGGLPFRLGSRAEVTLIRLRKGEQGVRG